MIDHSGGFRGARGAVAPPPAMLQKDGCVVTQIFANNVIFVHFNT